MAETVSSEAVAEYLPRVARLARMFNGQGGAEYDDLYQEGSIKVFELLRDGTHVSNTAIKNAMRDWVRRCYRKGFAYPTEEAILEREATWEDRHGRQKVTHNEATATGNSVWTRVGYAPE